MLPLGRRSTPRLFQRAHAVGHIFGRTPCCNKAETGAGHAHGFDQRIVTLRPDGYRPVQGIDFGQCVIQVEKFKGIAAVEMPFEELMTDVGSRKFPAWCFGLGALYDRPPASPLLLKACASVVVPLFGRPRLTHFTRFIPPTPVLSSMPILRAGRAAGI